MPPMRFSPIKIGSLVICVLLLLALPLPLSGQSKTAKKSADQMSSKSGGDADAVKDQLEKMEKDRAVAVVKADTATLEKTTVDDYTLVDMNGQVSNGKDKMINRIKSGDLKLTSDTVDDMSVHVYGNAAVVTGTATVSGKMGGKSVSNQKLRFTRVWVKHNGQWMSAALQQTPIK